MADAQPAVVHLQTRSRAVPACQVSSVTLRAVLKDARMSQASWEPALSLVGTSMLYALKARAAESIYRRKELLQCRNSTWTLAAIAQHACMHACMHARMTRIPVQTG